MGIDLGLVSHASVRTAISGFLVSFKHVKMFCFECAWGSSLVSGDTSHSALPGHEGSKGSEIRQVPGAGNVKHHGGSKVCFVALGRIRGERQHMRQCLGLFRVEKCSP